MTDLMQEQDPRVLPRVPTVINPAAEASPGMAQPISGPPAATPAMPQTLPRVPTPGQQQMTALGGLETPKQEKLTQLQGEGSRIDRIKNPVGRTFAHIGDAILGTFAPRAEQLIPGTEGNYALHLARAGNAVKGETELADTASKRALEQAQASDYESRPELKKLQADVAEQKAYEQGRHNQATEALGVTTQQGKMDTAASARKATLASHGFEEDEQGNIVPLAYERMSQEQQAVHDLKAAQTEQAEATAALKKAQAANAPAAMALAQARLQHGQQLAQIATRRLGLSEAQFELRSQGTVNGKPAEGALISDSGKPVGTALQNNVRPTGQERNKADMATSAEEQLNDIKSIVQKRKDIFGPVEGRKTDFTVWLGSEDPDAKRFLNARTIAGDHLAGTFGGRSEPALAALDAAIGHYKDNPAAILAGLDQLNKANKTFIKAGTVRTIGSNAGKEAAGEVIEYERNAQGKLVPKAKK